jgi:hypothetical protein
MRSRWNDAKNCADVTLEAEAQPAPHSLQERVFMTSTGTNASAGSVTNTGAILRRHSRALSATQAGQRREI